LSKETYVALGKAAAIVYKLGLHDTLRDLNKHSKIKKKYESQSEIAILHFPSVIKSPAQR